MLKWPQALYKIRYMFLYPTQLLRTHVYWQHQYNILNFENFAKGFYEIWGGYNSWEIFFIRTVFCINATPYCFFATTPYWDIGVHGTCRYAWWIYKYTSRYQIGLHNIHMPASFCYRHVYSATVAFIVWTISLRTMQFANKSLLAPPLCCLTYRVHLRVVIHHH